MASMTSCGQNGQPQTIVVNDPQVWKKIGNEYWSNNKGEPWAVHFNDYFFSEDGTFVQKFGYSGGAFYQTIVTGNYVQEDNIIKLAEISTKGFSPFHTNSDAIPLDMDIIELTDSTVTLKNHKDQKQIFSRRRGMIKDQTWECYNDTDEKTFRFETFGQCIYEDHNTEYVCEYQVFENIIFLQVKSKSVSKWIGDRWERTTTPYDPYLKKVIRFTVFDKNVEVEEIDFDVENDEWEMNNGNYIINEFVGKNRNKLVFKIRTY